MDRKARIREYKQTPQPMGIFRVLNGDSGKSFVGATLNLPGMLNRQRFQLEMGSHANPDLQADWNTVGGDKFEFEALDVLEPSEDPEHDPRQDLEQLLGLWVERLSAGGELYDERGRPRL